jgi:hypothetical protein
LVWLLVIDAAHCRVDEAFSIPHAVTAPAQRTRRAPRREGRSTCDSGELPVSIGAAPRAACRYRTFTDEHRMYVDRHGMYIDRHGMYFGRP